MKLRVSKKKCKRYIKDRKFKVISKFGRTFIINPTPNFLCSRWYAFVIVASNHEKLSELIAEGKMSIPEWKQHNRKIWNQYKEEREHQ